MWLILQHDKPEDFVIATGVQHTVREFATLAFHHAGIELRWEGEGVNEKGINIATGKVVVAVSEDFYRPTDVVNLWGDPTKAKKELGWNPQTTSFELLVKLMVKHDMAKIAADNAAADVRKMNLAEYLEKGIVKQLLLYLSISQVDKDICKLFIPIYTSQWCIMLATIRDI